MASHGSTVQVPAGCGTLGNGFLDADSGHGAFLSGVSHPESYYMLIAWSLSRTARYLARPAITLVRDTGIEPVALSSAVTIACLCDDRMPSAVHP